ncbi:MAG: BMC domain-containing protein [Armatimonadetes bacterium]|jgi:ethanolamine utilization protein EutM|nr:BMC domain-containing protein [Armatimonadota bacterium]
MPRQRSSRRPSRAADSAPEAPRALGLLETYGYTAAIQAADAAAKAADVTVLGYHLTRGKGWVCVKIEGSVAAVQVAVEAAREWAGRVNQVVATQVIARPDDETTPLIRSRETVGLGPRARGEMD